MNLMQGRRLQLRALTGDDAGPLHGAVEASREALQRRFRWVSSVRSAEDCRGFILAAARGKASPDAARDGALPLAAPADREVFVVAELRTGSLVGIAALQQMLAVPGLAELSFWVRSDRQDRGYAREAGKLLAAHAFRHDALQKLYARIDPANRPARKVLQNLGFRYEGCLRHEKRLNGRWIDQECWGLLRTEWRR